MKKLSFKILKFRILQKLFKKPLNIQKSWENVPTEYANMVDFLNWFDSTSSVEQCIEQAKVDWVHRFKNFEYFNEIKKENVLEIGFGGGRLLLQASKDFEKVYGIDIHKNFEMTKKFLNSQNINNVKLIHRDKIKSLKNKSFDLIYSFIVFQHFDSMDEVKFYLEAIERLLTKNGVAHIYFGKQEKDGFTVTSENDFLLRDCSLFINPKTMLELISQKFEICSFEELLPSNAVENTGESVQAMIIFKPKMELYHA